MSYASHIDNKYRATSAELERLRAENARLRAACEAIVSAVEHPAEGWAKFAAAYEAAKVALAKEATGA